MKEQKSNVFFCIRGPRKRFLATRTNSGYGDKTAVSELASKDVAVVMLGAGWDSCTVIHSVEERQMCRIVFTRIGIIQWTLVMG